MQYSQKAFRNLESEFLFISAVKYMRLNTFEDLKQKHYGQTDGWTDGWMDGPSYRDARTHLKINLTLYSGYCISLTKGSLN